jgi:hypothetical protein
MATNTFEVIDMVKKESQRVLHNNLGFTRGVNRQYDSSFANKGAKIGETLRIELPVKPYISNTANLVAQNYTESNVTLTVSNRAQAAIEFTSQDVTMSSERFQEWSKNKLEPFMARMATEIDMNGLKLAKNVYNSVGTPGTTPVVNANQNDFISARSVMNRFLAPQMDRTMCIDSTAAEGILRYNQALFNPSGQIGAMYKKGQMSGAPVYSFNWTEDENVAAFTTGTRANGTVSGANQTGANLTITGAGNAATFVVGDSFTIANVYSVNPENQQSTGHLQQFTVTANATMDANGANTLAITPSIVVAGANVGDGTVNALPANGANLTHIGNASTLARTNIAYQRDAFVLGTADLVTPINSGMCRYSEMDGIQMRIWADSDIRTDSHIMRFDILYGWALVRPELACKVFG